MKPLFFSVLVAIVLSVAACRPQGEDAPAPSQVGKPKAGDVKVYSRNDASGRLVYYIKDSLIAPVDRWPDSLVAIRLAKQSLDPSTGLLVNDPTLAPVPVLVTFARVLYNDTSLRTGPEPITFKSLEDFMTKANLSLADIYHVVSGDFVANARKWEFLELAYAKLKPAYPQGFGFGADWEDLVEEGNISIDNFFTAVDNANLSDGQLLDLMEQRRATFNLIKVRWLSSADTTLSGLVGVLNLLKVGPLREGNFDKTTKAGEVALRGNLDYSPKVVIGAGVSYTPTLIGNPNRTVYSRPEDVYIRFRPLFSGVYEGESVTLTIKGNRHNGIAPDWSWANVGDLYVERSSADGMFLTLPSIWAYISLQHAYAETSRRPCCTSFQVVYKFRLYATSTFMHNIDTDIYVTEFIR